MIKPKIKREHSPERLLSTAAAKPRGAIATLFAASPAHQKMDDDTARTRPKQLSRPTPRKAEDRGSGDDSSKGLHLLESHRWTDFPLLGSPQLPRLCHLPSFVDGTVFRFPRPVGTPSTPAELIDDESEYGFDDGFGTFAVRMKTTTSAWRRISGSFYSLLGWKLPNKKEKAGGEKVHIGMVVIRRNAVIMLEVLDRTNVDMPKVGRISMKRRGYILSTAFGTGCQCLELAVDRCKSTAGLQRNSISGPIAICRRTTYYRDKFGDLTNEPNAGPPASFVDGPEAAISTSRTKAKVVFMPVATYRYILRINDSSASQQTLEFGRSFKISQ
ncbi:hypothetical protein E8E11_005106 [Didymella keratinophila]|nr:hypothetical protein E8E11_005106 [Didymella keratinophila]